MYMWMQLPDSLFWRSELLSLVALTVLARDKCFARWPVVFIFQFLFRGVKEMIYFYKQLHALHNTALLVVFHGILGFLCYMYLYVWRI